LQAAAGDRTILPMDLELAPPAAICGPDKQEAPGHKLWSRRSQLDHWRSGGHNGAAASKTLPQNYP
jgi:hypothetical protein